MKYQTICYLVNLQGRSVLYYAPLIEIAKLWEVTGHNRKVKVIEMVNTVGQNCLTLTYEIITRCMWACVELSSRSH